MKTLKILMLALLCAICLPSKADEGMWLLQMMQEKHLIDRLKAMGLALEADDVYSPNKVSLKDAVGIFAFNQRCSFNRCYAFIFHPTKTQCNL